MRMRSTGLGKTELIADVESIKRVGGYLMVSVNSTDPVKWHIRVAVSYRDVLKVAKCGALSIVWFLISGVRGIFAEPAPPEEY